jgi:maltose O-acetyltransferase
VTTSVLRRSEGSPEPDSPLGAPIAETPDGTAARAAHRIAVAWRMVSEDLRRWPFELSVNVVLASPLVPRLVRVTLLRVLGMQLHNLDLYPRCHFRSTKLKVGRGTVINSDCHFGNDDWIEIGDYAGVAMNVSFLTTGHALGPSELRAGDVYTAPIVVGHGAWIGANAVILPGVTIGDGCVIGAGSIVRTDCAPDSLYCGVPAKLVKQFDGAPSGEAETD